jgi:hypothetical protein
MAEYSLLQAVLKVGGITALAIGVFYLIYRQILQLQIFRKIGATQTFVVICLLAILTWSAAMAVLFVRDSSVNSFVLWSSGVNINQGK